MSGNLKISIDNSSMTTAGKTLQEEAQPHVLGLVLECRPMAGSKNTTFTSIIGMDMIIQDVDPRYAMAALFIVFLYSVKLIIFFCQLCSE